MNVRVHHDIQMDLSKIIVAAIKAQLPNAYDIKFDKLYSETLNADHVKVLFAYMKMPKERKIIFIPRVLLKPMEQIVVKYSMSIKDLKMTEENPQV